MSRVGLTPVLWDGVMDRDGGVCCYCGFPAAEVDHVVPVSRGGGNDVENLVAACRECNREKLDLTVSEWAARRVSDGKPWPIPRLADRIKALWPSVEDMAKALACMADDYEPVRAQLVAARNIAPEGLPMAA